MAVTVTCSSAEVKPNSGSSVQLEVENGDFNTDEIYDEIDVTKFCEYQDIEIMEEE